MYSIITNKRKPNNLELENINLEEEFKSKGTIPLYNEVQLIFKPSVVNKTFYDNTDNFKLLLNNLDNDQQKTKVSKIFLKSIYNLFAKYNSLDSSFIEDSMQTLKDTNILSQTDIENYLIDYLIDNPRRGNGMGNGLLAAICLAYHNDNMYETFEMYKNIANNIGFKYKEDFNLSQVLNLKSFGEEVYFLRDNIYKDKEYIEVKVGDDEYLIKVKSDDVEKLKELLKDVNNTSNHTLLNQMLNELNKHYNFNPKLPIVENNEKLKLEFTSIYLIKKDIDYNAIEKMLYDFKNKDNDKVMKDFMRKF